MNTTHPLLGYFMVAGVKFSDYKKLKPKDLKPGVTIVATTERNNPKDPRAIRLTINNVHIGYVPTNGQYGHMNYLMWKIKSINKKCFLTLKAYNPNNPSWETFYVEVRHEKLIEVRDESKEERF